MTETSIQSPAQPVRYALVPEWATDETANLLFGLTHTRLYELRRDGHIRWKRLPTREEKAGRSVVRGRVLNHVGSIRAYIEALPGGEPKK